MLDLLLLWALPAVVAVHNLEEALWLPQWSRERAQRWRPPAGAWEFRFALTVITLAVFLFAALTQIGGWSSIWHYLIAAYALGQSLNIFVPHLVASIDYRTVMPGLLSGVLLVLPTAVLFLYRSFLESRLELDRFLPVATVVIVLLLLSLPVLFAVGRKVQAYLGT